MANKSLGNPYDADTDLQHGPACNCPICVFQKEQVQSNYECSETELTERLERAVFEGTTTSEMHELVGAEQADFISDDMQQTLAVDPNPLESSEDIMDRVIESAVVRGIFGHDDMGRRDFMRMVGGGTFAAMLGSMLPMDDLKAAIKDNLGKPEKSKLKVGFVPITCATPIIMAHPMGFLCQVRAGCGRDQDRRLGGGRDKSLAKEYDASHMLTPMPLAITMGSGSTEVPFRMPAVENINGQAIVLHMKHKDKRDPKDWKGFKFGVPFDYSMHNFLLRYYVAEHGIDPDKDIQIRVVPPPGDGGQPACRQP